MKSIFARIRRWWGLRKIKRILRVLQAQDKKLILNISERGYGRAVNGEVTHD